MKKRIAILVGALGAAAATVPSLKRYLKIRSM
jgi:hypothetical protein